MDMMILSLLNGMQGGFSSSIPARLFSVTVPGNKLAVFSIETDEITALTNKSDELRYADIIATNI
ncbi:hypothetical protein [Raoultella scottii]|uniref:hypothetical protein n=1 Tax=Raoultella scottii TaxID=3040937 RepID=UPI002F98AD64